jgi:TetR/AcrR family transcriptional regulator, regulator of autoinduction and epiphytic fitness
MQVVADTGTIDDIEDHVDGRSLRRERNREAVIEAFLALVREGNFDPGGAEIAQRAGVSHRSVFRYFADLADLMMTAIAREVERGLPLGAVEQIGEGTFEERLERLVDAHLTMLDKLHGIATVTRIRAVTMPSLTTAFAEIAAGFRAVLERHFAPELAHFSDADRPGITDGLQVLLSWDAYDVHRRLYGHDVERIRTSTITAVTALLNPST